MKLWRYKAVPIKSSFGARVQTGELSGETPGEVRAQLRGVGLAALEVSPIGRRFLSRGSGRAGQAGRWSTYLRDRRRGQRVELFDSLATMMDSGIPLGDALSGLLEGVGSNHQSFRTLLLSLRESLRSGRSFSESVCDFPAWFDGIECALVQAGEQSGTLPDCLRTLASRQETQAGLRQRLVGALAYPAIVVVVGLGAVLFLSQKTLPQLVQILEGASLEVPGLTRFVMGAGDVVLKWGLLGMGVGVVLFVLGGRLLRVSARESPRFGRWLVRLSPAFLRQAQVGQVMDSLAAMLGGGVPLTTALRAMIPTIRSKGLERALHHSVSAMESGERFSESLRDPMWFDAGCRQMIKVGERTGDLETILKRLSSQYQRRSERLMSRTVSLVEPLVIIILAVLVGCVVMAAILPMIQLQELL